MITLHNIQYETKDKTTAILISRRKGIEGQTNEGKTQAQIDAENYPMSDRNGANAYIVNLQREKVYLNFIPEKTHLSDDLLDKYGYSDFEYFLDPVPLPTDPFILADGQIFRCVDENSVPKAKESYVYYIMSEGVAKEIPNYKTLEVMLAERGESLLSVRVLMGSMCSDIPKSGAIQDKASVWIDSYKDFTNEDVLAELNNNAASAESMMVEAGAKVTEQVEMVKAQAAADKAAAEAAKAEAEAAAAASAAAVAEANAAKAEAEAAKAEADAAKAEFESQKE